MSAPGLVVDPDRLLDPDLHAEGDPHAVWSWMRDQAPVHRHEDGALPSFWSLTRYADVRDAYRDPAVFSSAHGVLLRPTALGADPGAGLTLALTDDPRHHDLRAAVADWFSTRSVRDLEDFLRAAARRVLAEAVDRGTFDVVHDLVGPLSMATIGHIVGVPAADHAALVRWTDEAFAAGISLAGHQELMRYFADLIDLRVAEPRDDVVSALVGAEVDGDLLAEEEILLNCENLIGATENGRLALAGGIEAFLDHPQEWDRLRADRSLLAGAVEEVLRWTSSAVHSMRTTTRPVEVAGTPIGAGERVVVWLPSANRDPAVFADPHRFDVGRGPNRHVALGGGPHFCLGSILARAQGRALLTELLDAPWRLERAGRGERVRSLAVAGPETLPVRPV
ncbi:cytochrome P450 [Actinokineospora sp. NBRC 105648]|uniref:cytochrome P450 n=1 Tax=Actinokineospora sp. NBRC 105648 TaxID=3032206 RepID=UPI0024A36395|nr:cytochrome P450 [Actinokineospora sp. NBRC 105648]GLZ38108.1 cytochrome P450 [Actinokineospora sp. NBRC 105648]